MAHRLEGRVRKIESALQGPAQMRVISGYSAEEHVRTMRHMIEAGEAREDDFFVCIRRFAEPAEVAR
jgi:hypothetical protein